MPSPDLDVGKPVRHFFFLLMIDIERRAQIIVDGTTPGKVVLGGTKNKLNK